MACAPTKLHSCLPPGDVWRVTPGEPDSYSNKPEPHAQKARVKHPVLRPDQDPLEHTPILRLVGLTVGEPENTT